MPLDRLVNGVVPKLVLILWGDPISVEACLSVIWRNYIVFVPFVRIAIPKGAVVYLE